MTKQQLDKELIEQECKRFEELWKATNFDEHIMENYSDFLKSSLTKALEQGRREMKEEVLLEIEMNLKEEKSPN